MKATITGNDALSKRILLDLQSGLRVSEIPEHYPVSLDQAKRLSRYRRMLDLAKDNLEEEQYKRLQLLGLKSLPLSNLFKKVDWAGIAEILSVVTDETTRDELPMLIGGLAEKRKRILEFKENADLILSQLEDTDKMLRNKEKEVLKIKKDMDEKVKMFKSYPEPFRSFLSEYLGLYEGELVLAKRLNTNWQRDLRKEEIIVYDEMLYVHFIKDINAFVESLISRHQRGLEYRWNPDKDIQRIMKTTPSTDIPESGKYRLPSSFNDPFIDAVNHLNQELLEIQEKRLTIQEELNNMKSKTVHSYMEMAEVSDFLSTIDLKRHKELQDKALKWLYQRGFIAVAEFALPNRKRADIFAYNESQITIFEIKVSQGDLNTDKKWPEYLPYCHDFYFLTPPELAPMVTKKIKSVDCGQYVDTGNGLRLIKPDNRQVTEVNKQDELMFAAGQLLSRKFIYGY
jgi:hypothetical protein